MGKISCLHVLHIASIKSSAENKNMLLLSPFFIFTSLFFILAKAFRNGYVVACSTVCRSATAKNEGDGYVTAPCLSMTQLNSTADWMKF